MTGALVMFGGMALIAVMITVLDGLASRQRRKAEKNSHP
jgi:hypothetical protein